MVSRKPPTSNPTELSAQWDSSPRWKGVRRDYRPEDVLRLRGSVMVEQTLAERGAERLWWLLGDREVVAALGALSGGQAVQMVRAGLEAIYLSGWQVAADANLAEKVYPDQSLYPATSAPALVRRLNNALRRADQVESVEGGASRDWLVPIAADVAGVPTVLIARTDALSATLLTTDVDERDRPFLTGDRTAEGYWRIRPGLEAAIARGLASAPYADLLWFETSTPDLDEAASFAAAVHAEYPGKPLAYNCSPSFNWRKHLDEPTIARFQKELGRLGYRFQFITLAGFHALNAAMFELASGFAERGMPAYVELQQRELALEAEGYTATRHQREVGTGYFDAVSEVISGGTGATLAMAGSTEAAQF